MRSASARVLIAGYGFVGRALGRRLSERGHCVWGIRRSYIDGPEDVEVVTADLSRPLDPAHLPEAPDYVVYLLSSDERSDAAYRRARVEGLNNLIEALQSRHARPVRLFYASSTGVYPHSDGSWVDEDTPVTTAGFEASRLLEGEALTRSCPFPATVVRFAGIYGAGRIRLLGKIARANRLAPRARPSTVIASMSKTARPSWNTSCSSRHLGDSIWLRTTSPWIAANWPAGWPTPCGSPSLHLFPGMRSGPEATSGVRIAA